MHCISVILAILGIFMVAEALPTVDFYVCNAVHWAFCKTDGAATSTDPTVKRDINYVCGGVSHWAFCNRDVSPATSVPTIKRDGTPSTDMSIDETLATVSLVEPQCFRGQHIGCSPHYCLCLSDGDDDVKELELAETGETKDLNVAFQCHLPLHLVCGPRICVCLPGNDAAVAAVAGLEVFNSTDDFTKTNFYKASFYKANFYKTNFYKTNFYKSAQPNTPLQALCGDSRYMVCSSTECRCFDGAGNSQVAIVPPVTTNIESSNGDCAKVWWLCFREVKPTLVTKDVPGPHEMQQPPKEWLARDTHSHICDYAPWICYKNTETATTDVVAPAGPVPGAVVIDVQRRSTDGDCAKVWWLCFKETESLLPQSTAPSSVMESACRLSSGLLVCWKWFCQCVKEDGSVVQLVGA